MRWFRAFERLQVFEELQGVVESRAGREQSEVLEGLDLGLTPAPLPVPSHHQHVIVERLPEQQGSGFFCGSCVISSCPSAALRLDEAYRLGPHRSQRTGRKFGVQISLPSSPLKPRASF